MKHQSGHTTLAAEQGAKDPVCGMNVDPNLPYRPFGMSTRAKPTIFAARNA